MNSNIEQLIKERDNLFVERRTIIESEVNKFFTSIQSFDATMKSNLPPITGSTAREVLPSLWQTPFNQDVYKREVAALNAYVNAAVAEADRVNSEVAEWLEKSKSVAQS